MSFLGGLMLKNPPATAEDSGDVGCILGSWRSPGEGKGNNPLQYSCPENAINWEDCRATLHGVMKNQT